MHPKSTDFVPDGIAFIIASDISEDKINFQNCHKISYNQYQALRIGFSISGDILLSHKASIGFVAKVPDHVKEIMLTPQVTYYRVLKEEVLLKNYLEYFLRSTLYQTPLQNLAKQSTRDYIGITLQKSLNVLFPSNINEQIAISDKLITIQNTLQTEQAYLQKLYRLKAGLMGDLLSGRVRVKDA
jgi:type I restriction enzyme S subunit